jgi:cellobiose PTS system EIIB component
MSPQSDEGNTMKIVLCCNAGMSTSMLVKKMREAAQTAHQDVSIDAAPSLKSKRRRADADVLLLGPQVRYELKHVQGVYPDKHVEAIAPTDYGMLRGDKVLARAFELMNQQ